MFNSTDKQTVDSATAENPLLAGFLYKPIELAYTQIITLENTHKRVGLSLALIQNMQILLI